jgi:hypothetical protein
VATGAAPPPKGEDPATVPPKGEEFPVVFANGRIKSILYYQLI